MIWQRVILIVLDGVGVGAQPDAAAYGDADANTLLHVAERCGGLRLPTLERLGLGSICPVPGVAPVARPKAACGRMLEVSAGKDTTTGHWELAGLVQDHPFATFPQGFPDHIIAAFEAQAGVRVLGNVAASGTEILRQLGDEHRRSGRPIVYTSVDSVFQIAAHEDVMEEERLYELCRIARRLLDPWRVGRVIARPFTGDGAETYVRTPRRRDFAMPPGAPTLLDRLKESGRSVYGVGKIHDIFAGQGLTGWVKTAHNREGMQRTREALQQIPDGLIFTNLVDFDMLYGHRLDAGGFGRALEEFDVWLADFLTAMQPADLLLVTADHGCDPTTPGTDHSREIVPLLVWGAGLAPGVDLGVRESFADVAATLAELFQVAQPCGRSFLGRIRPSSA